jgi:hypothetical protein
MERGRGGRGRGGVEGSASELLARRLSKTVAVHETLHRVQR